ncbi:MAG: alpha-galactosidase [Prevotella sp.]|nr:alpha-galactosidase [Prevotella sp.]MDY4039651.1 alpha-galactosidase [Prevotella sp.]
MKHFHILLTSLVIVATISARGQQRLIQIPAGSWKLSLMVGADLRLYQLGCGSVSEQVFLPEKTPAREREWLPAYGNGYVAEPAVQVTHADGNTSLDLCYVRHHREELPDEVSLTKIEMKDTHYAFYADIYVKAYRRMNLLEIWTVYRNAEPEGAVTLNRFASASPLIDGRSYWLTQFNGHYKHEATMEEERLGRGVKQIGSTLGVRSHYYVMPAVMVSCGGPASEDSGEVYGLALSWSGNFLFAFDHNWSGALRVIGGINPLGGQYRLDRDSSLVTPTLVWCRSSEGTGTLSRNLHRWADRYVVRDPDRDRPVLLNNWEATHCDFDEQRLTKLFDGARQVRAELFLLDDGWFGNDSCARNDDRHGLGDWQVNRNKLPHGLGYLANEAHKRGLGLGIWLEPEMVNPASQLFQAHPNWVIRQPFREPILGRHQEILDLTRPEVYAFERQIFADVLGRNPGIGYVKWDCNRFVTQPGSSYLPADRQSHLLTDYTFRLYSLMADMVRRYPKVMAMLCAGGGGRADYGSMRYFHSLWPSDNTDPIDRIKIQWGFGHFFPAKTLSAHVTRMGKRHLKLAIDVAMSGAFGIDLAIDQATQLERSRLAHAVDVYKRQVRPLVMHGDLYRLLSPYTHDVAALSYVAPDRRRAVVYLYQTGDLAPGRVCLKGLDPDAQYVVRELDTACTDTIHLADCHASGCELMSAGVSVRLKEKYDSAILEIIQL